MSDIFVFLIIYLIVSAVTFWAVQSLFKSIENENGTKLPHALKAKLAFACSTMYLLPLLFVKSVGIEALFLYALTIPLAIFATMKIPQTSISFKTALVLFFGISVKLIAAMIFLGAAARLIGKIIKQ